MTEEKPLILEVFEKAGGRQALGSSLGLSKQALSDWVREGRVPVKHCLAVHLATGIAMGRLNPALELAKEQAKALKAKSKKAKRSATA